MWEEERVVLVLLLRVVGGSGKVGVGGGGYCFVVLSSVVIVIGGCEGCGYVCYDGLGLWLNWVMDGDLYEMWCLVVIGRNGE